jgi:hypothetical protein
MARLDKKRASWHPPRKTWRKNDPEAAERVKAAEEENKPDPPPEETVARRRRLRREAGLFGAEDEDLRRAPGQDVALPAGTWREDGHHQAGLPGLRPANGRGQET